MNIFLVVFKTIVGILSKSIAIVIDAVNNLSDTISAIITLVGAKLSSKAPDKEHPFGHGRIEYVAAFIISMIILWAGIKAFNESVIKIIEPVKAQYEWTTFAVIIVAILVKFFFAKHVKKVGKEINSQGLIATGTDAYMDAIIAFSTLICGLISLYLGKNVEGYVGVIISIVIIKSSIGILKETVDMVIGNRVDSALAKSIRKRINGYDGVYGTYDLMLHSYGPETMVGSAHIQVKDDMTAKEIHSLTRKIAKDIFREYSIILTIGIYALNESGEAGIIKKEIEKIIKNYPEVLQLHGFYVDKSIKQISFDLIFDFNCKEKEEIRKKIMNSIKKKYEGYDVEIFTDSDITD